VLLALAHRDHPDKLCLLFLVELASYVLALFEVHDVVLYLYRGPLVTYLIVALYLDELRLGARWLRQRIPIPWRTASA
jgi:hypothetical protein